MSQPFEPWWDVYPGRLESEISRLEAAGVTVAVNIPRRDDDAVIELALSVPDAYTGRGVLELVATFPDFYPYYRPEVVAPSLALGLHQHPFGKNLCLVGRASRNWQPSDTLAWLITGQLERALDLGTSGAGGPGEEDQGEPFSDYYSYAQDAAVFVDSAWSLPASHRAGPADLLLPGAVAPGRGVLFHAYPAKLASEDAYLLAGLEDEIVPKGLRPVAARWSVLDEPVTKDSGRALWVAASKADAVAPPRHPDSASSLQYRLIGFPEEHRRGDTGLGWLMVIRHTAARHKAARGRVDHQWYEPEDTFDVVRAARIGRGDLQERVPDRLAPLAAKNVVIFGLGAIGGTLATHLAKNQVGALTLIDRDQFEPGNASRHVCGTNASGLSKSGAVGGLARSFNPYVEVSGGVFTVGAQVSGLDQRQLLADAIANADLVIDATAEVGIQELTANLAGRMRTPWLVIEASNGAWGGTVALIPGDSDACFACLQRHRIDRSIPLPPADPADPTQPIGCAEPTFTGASFDLDEVPLQGARLAVAALIGQPEAQAHILSLRGQGEPTLPRWEAHRIGRHGACPH